MFGGSRPAVALIAERHLPLEVRDYKE